MSAAEKKGGTAGIKTRPFGVGIFYALTTSETGETTGVAVLWK